MNYKNTNIKTIVNRLMLTTLMMALALIARADIAHFSANAGEKSILIITSYERQGVEKKQGIADNISEFISSYKMLGGKNAIIMESLACAGINECHEWRGRMKTIFQKYNDENRPGLILLVGQEALATYLSLSEKEILGSPVICGMASRNFIEVPAEKITITEWFPESRDIDELLVSHHIVGGCLIEYNLDKNINLIKRLLPDTRNLAILTDNSYGGISMLTFIKKEMLHHDNLNIITLDGRMNNFYEVIDKTAKMPENTVVLLGTWRLDKTGSSVIKATLSTIHEANPKLPAVSISSLGMNSWALGGYYPAFPNQGADLAQIAYNYLSSSHQTDKHRDLRIIKNEYIFDYNELKKYGIDEALLPEGSTVINRDPGLWKSHRKLIIQLSVIFFILLTILIIVSIAALRMRRLKMLLEESQANLEEARQIADKNNEMKTRFLANMSHEIRAPMNAIVGFSELLVNYNNLSDEERNNFAQIIKQNSDILLNIINEILDISRIENNKTKYAEALCNLYDICHNAFDSVKMTAQNSEVEYIFNADIDQQKCDICADNNRLHQLILNLLTNATKFTEKGQITLSIAGDRFGYTTSVADTGIGISADMHLKVFEPYIKVNEFSEGTGLGLSLCKKIVEHYGGRIWVDPEYFNGTRIIFTLPLSSVGIDNNKSLQSSDNQ